MGQKAALGWEKLKPLLKKPGGAHPKKDGDGALAAPAANSAKALTKEIAEATGTTVGSIEQIKAIEHKAPEIAAAAKAGKKSIRAALGWEQLKPLLKKPGRPKSDGETVISAPAHELTEKIAKASGACVKSIKEISALEHKAPEVLVGKRHSAPRIKRYSKRWANSGTALACRGLHYPARIAVHRIAY